MSKEKLRKVGFYFITGCLIKPFKMTINHNGKLNIYFKNNFNLLVINVIQLNWQNVHI